MKTVFVINILILCALATSGQKGVKKSIFYNPLETLTLNLSNINSKFDDYNVIILDNKSLTYKDLYFSSNRDTQGKQFDIIAYGFYMPKKSKRHKIIAYRKDPTKLLTSIKSRNSELGPFYYTTDANQDFDLFFYSIDSSTVLRSNLIRTGKYEGNNQFEVCPICLDSIWSTSNIGYTSFDIKLGILFQSDLSGNYDIYCTSSKIENKLFSNENPLLIDDFISVDQINSPYNDKCPIIFENYVFFASDRPGGYGGYDLYYSIVKENSWRKPVNLGPDINSVYDDFRPFIFDYDGKICLIFSSDRPGGHGGFDLYFTRLDLATILSKNLNNLNLNF